MLTAAAGDVEGEAACGVSPFLGVKGLGKKLSYISKDAGVGCGVGARGPPYWGLVDVYHLVKVVGAVKGGAVA